MNDCRMLRNSSTPKIPLNRFLEFKNRFYNERIISNIKLKSVLKIEIIIHEKNLKNRVVILGTIIVL